MRFNVRFKIGGRLGAASRYSLVEICIHLVDKYSLKEKEIARIVTMNPGEAFTNEDMEVTRLAPTAHEVAAQQQLSTNVVELRK